MAGIAWNSVPPHIWNCSIFEVLSDKRNQLELFVCPCGKQKAKLKEMQKHLLHKHKRQKRSKVVVKMQNLLDQFDDNFRWEVPKDKVQIAGKWH